MRARPELGDHASTAIASSVGGNPYPLTKASDIVGVFLKALVAVGS